MKNKKILPWIVTVLLLIAYAFSQNIIKIHYYHYETPHFNPAFFEEDFDSISTVKSYAIEMDFVEATEEDYLQALALKYHFSSDYAEKINKEQTKDRLFENIRNSIRKWQTLQKSFVYLPRKNHHPF